MDTPPDHRPGDIILDHFVPHLKGEDRELARKRLQGLAKLLLTAAIREVRSERAQVDSRESDSKGKIQPTPSSSA
jgi:hypothetical protein